MTRNVRLGDVVVVGWAVWVVLLGWLGWESAIAQEEPKEVTELGAIEKGPHSGEQVFNLFCIGCHAPRAQGSPLGKSLVDTQAVTMTDAAMVKVISDGRPDHGMMAFGRALAEEEIIGAIQYIRELQGKAAPSAAAAPAEPPAGNAAPAADLINF